MAYHPRVRAQHLLPAAMFLALVACGAQSEPPKVAFGESAVKIESGMYSDDVAYADNTLGYYEKLDERVAATDE